MTFLRRPFVRALATALLALVCSGCASGSQAEKKELFRLNEKLVRLQNENDRLSDRVAALELRAQADRAHSEESPSRADVFERPPLKVIRVDPDSATPSTDPGPEPGRKASEPNSDEQRAPAARRPVLFMRGKKAQVEPPGPS